VSIITTQDGTTIIVHPEIGAVSGRTREEAQRELERRLSGQRAAHSVRVAA
jgi:hypothetical protein